MLTDNNSCDGHPLGKNEFWRQLIQRQEQFYLPQDCFKYKNATGAKIRGRQLQQWVGCNFGLLNYSSIFLSIFGSPQNVNCWFLFEQCYVFVSQLVNLPWHPCKKHALASI
jgi:hypothetical protein